MQSYALTKAIVRDGGKDILARACQDSTDPSVKKVKKSGGESLFWSDTLRNLSLRPFRVVGAEM